MCHVYLFPQQLTYLHQLFNVYSAKENLSSCGMSIVEHCSLDIGNRFSKWFDQKSHKCLNFHVQYILFKVSLLPKCIWFEWVIILKTVNKIPFICFSCILALFCIFFFNNFFEAHLNLELSLIFLFICQVGDPYIDHAYWGRPEDMAMDRPAFKLTPESPGSDLVAETAAALAAGYLAFKNVGKCAL